jgi:Zn-dependent protease
MNDINLTIFSIVVLIFSAIIHEFMHGWMADRLGDPTARLAGRLTLNPIAHIDPVGSIFLPLLMILSGTRFVFGWAKPVPFNPYNLKDQRYGSAKVAVAGPAANLATALFFGLILRLFGSSPLLSSIPYFSPLLEIVVIVNLMLGIFNSLPIPPLDGSKIIAPFLSYDWQVRLARLEQHGMILVILFVFLGLPFITPIIYFLFNLITGYGGM